MVPAMTPHAKPAATRVSVASAWLCSSPVLHSSAKVAKITDGGGTSRPFDQPRATAISQKAASPMGIARPSSGRA
jgi:hypothetical protein